MRAFVAIRQHLILKPADNIAELHTELKELKAYIEDIFTDQIDINEDTRMQLELINQSLAEMQTDKKLSNKPIRRIGFNAEQ